jgi:tRNA modification GTPase
VQIEGIPVELIDTAGLRAATVDAIESEGMRRARAAIARADLLLFLVDAAADPAGRSFDEERPSLPAGVPVTLVLNKIDLAPTGAQAAAGIGSSGVTRLAISAATGAGMNDLRRHIAARAGQVEEGGGACSARARHVDALRRAAAHLEAAHDQLTRKQGELAALELREAQRTLGEVVGDVTSDELLGQIFGNFCIGK